MTLDDLKARHDAVVLAIGAWWGKKMGIPGEDRASVIDGVQFLRDVNEGARPEMPETVVVIGGGDVAMDACRVARRLPGCKHVKVIYRRGPGGDPARKIELEARSRRGSSSSTTPSRPPSCRRATGSPCAALRRRWGTRTSPAGGAPVNVPGTEHDIACGMVIASVGQEGLCGDLDRRGLMQTDRVRTAWEGMRTNDPMVFAAGDGAFGGSTIVMAMNHGQRVAYYVKAYLEGRADPLPYKTPYRTQRVPGGAGPGVGASAGSAPRLPRPRQGPCVVPRDRDHLWLGVGAQGGGTVLPLRCRDRLRRLCSGAP